MSLSETFFDLMPEMRQFPARALKVLDNLKNLDFKALSFDDAANQYRVLDDMSDDMSYYSQIFQYRLADEEQVQVDLFFEKFAEFKKTMEHHILKFADNCNRDRNSKVYKMTIHGGDLSPWDNKGFAFENTFWVSLQGDFVQQFIDAPHGVMDFKGPILYEGHDLPVQLVLLEKPEKDERVIVRATLSHTREEIYYMLVNVLLLVNDMEKNTQI